MFPLYFRDREYVQVSPAVSQKCRTVLKDSITTLEWPGIRTLFPLIRPNAGIRNVQSESGFRFPVRVCCTFHGGLSNLCFHKMSMFLTVLSGGKREEKALNFIGEQTSGGVVILYLQSENLSLLLLIFKIFGKF
jgi:hypothetical protein